MVIVLKSILIADIGERQNRTSVQLALQAGAVLVTGRLFVVINVEAGDAGGINWPVPLHPVESNTLGFSTVTLLFVTLRLKGMLGPALYISFP